MEIETEKVSEGTKNHSTIVADQSSLKVAIAKASCWRLGHFTPLVSDDVLVLMEDGNDRSTSTVLPQHVCKHQAGLPAQRESCTLRLVTV